MAEVRIEDGKITRVFHEGRGMEVAESWTVKGETFTRKWACWFDSAHGLVEGQTVTVVGLVGVKVEEWKDKQEQVRHSAKLSVNDARIIGEPSSATSSSGVTEPDVWNIPGPYAESDAPF